MNEFLSNSKNFFSEQNQLQEKEINNAISLFVLHKVFISFKQSSIKL